MSQLPTPEQLAALAREYATCRPISRPVPAKPACTPSLCRQIAEVRAYVTPLSTSHNPTVQTLAQKALSAIDVTMGMLCASEPCDSAKPPSVTVRTPLDCLRGALLASTKFCTLLYEGEQIGESWPMLAARAHHIHSLLLTLAAL